MDEREETTGRLVRLREGWSDVAARTEADAGDARPSSGGRPKESVSLGLVFGIIAGALVLVLFVLAFVIRSNPAAIPPQPPPPPAAWTPQAPLAAATAFAAPTEGAMIAGTVLYTGKPITPRAFSTVPDPACTAPVFTEDIVVNPNGTLANVFVYVKSGLPKKTYPAPRAPLMMDSRGCRMVPHVLGVQIGQEIVFRNSDPTAINLNIAPKRNTPFNRGQPKMGMMFSHVFKAREVAIPVSDAVHPWKSAYICVMDHPYFNVTNTAGVFRLEALPPGTYTIESWHERLGTTTQIVTIKDGEVAKITITYRCSAKP